MVDFKQVVECFPNDIALLRVNELGVGLKLLESVRLNLEVDLLKPDLNLRFENWLGVGLSQLPSFESPLWWL
jgi:hypothetical protein